MRKSEVRKIFFVVMIATVMMILAACGGENNVASPTPAPTEEIKATATPALSPYTTKTPDIESFETHTYTWIPFEKDSNDNLDAMTIRITTKGNPNKLGSKITIDCVDTYFDYKIFDEIKLTTASEVTVLNKDNKPEWADGDGGIFAFPGQGFNVSFTEEAWKWIDVAFTYTSAKNVRVTFTLHWGEDGTLTADAGTLEFTEQ